MGNIFYSDWSKNRLATGPIRFPYSKTESGNNGIMIGESYGRGGIKSGTLASKLSEYYRMNSRSVMNLTTRVISSDFNPTTDRESEANASQEKELARYSSNRRYQNVQKLSTQKKKGAVFSKEKRMPAKRRR